MAFLSFGLAVLRSYLQSYGLTVLQPCSLAFFQSYGLAPCSLAVLWYSNLMALQSCGLPIFHIGNYELLRYEDIPATYPTALPALPFPLPLPHLPTIYILTIYILIIYIIYRISIYVKYKNCFPFAQCASS